MVRFRLSILAAAVAALPLVASCDDGGTSTTSMDTSSADTVVPDGGDCMCTCCGISEPIECGAVCACAACPGDMSQDGDASVNLDQTLCAAIRGNGELIFSHFASLARIHEHYGLLSGVSGGSSGSITSFVTESFYANPHVFDCGGTPCTEAESAQRISLLYKALQGYIVVLQGTQEALAFSQLAPILQAALDQGVDGLIANGDFSSARDALVAILGSPDIADVVNDEVTTLLATTPDIAYHTADIWTGLSSFGSFDATDPAILIRPGIIDFAQLARKIGRIGSFFAAYGPEDAVAWQTFLNECAAPSRGLDWATIAALPAGNSTCGDHFVDMATTYRTAFIADEDNWPNRIDDIVGTHLSAVIATSVLEGAAVSEWELARGLYEAAQPYTLDVNFDNVGFGYWANAEDMSVIFNNPMGYDDAKTTRLRALGAATWETALSMSPAEPGLARAIEITNGQISAGGWPDLTPTLVLRNLGCDQVILVTRQGDESQFGIGVARLLGMDATDEASLYSFTEDSALRRSLEAADAAWCTNWNAFSGLDVPGISADSYSAPLETVDPFFTASPDAYGNISASVNLPSCTPGVAP